MVNKKRHSKYMYGKLYHDTFEFRKNIHDLFSHFFENHPELEMTTHNEIVDLRNKVVTLLNSWIGSKKIESKCGIKIPLHAHSPSLENILEKKAQLYNKIYEPCEICGENRITNNCHILPYSVGGPDDEENFVHLCPTHHHLFDHNRLNKEEWQKLDFSKKLKASQEYVRTIRLPQLKEYWKNISHKT